MIYQCSSCGQEIKVPDDYTGPSVGCPNCREELSLGGEPGHEGRRSGGAISPEEFRLKQASRQFRKRIVVVVVLLVILGGGAALFFNRGPIEKVMGYFSGLADKQLRAKIYKAAGLAPVRYYQSMTLPGLRGQTGSEGGWDMQEEGMIYLVVETDAAPRHFLPSEEDYKRIVEEEKLKQERDPSHEIPGPERCRIFEPEKFALIVEGELPVRGALINLNHGEYRGFYDSFRVVYPKGSAEADAGGYLDEALLLSVAFAVPKSGLNLEKLYLQLDGVNPLKVPVAKTKSPTKESTPEGSMLEEPAKEEPAMEEPAKEEPAKED